MASADILRAAHTELPWSGRLDGPRQEAQVVFACSADDNWPWVIAKCVTRAPNDETGENNAAFIVRACNAHYQMLEALKMVEMICRDDGHFALMKMVRAAIALAEAEAGR